LFANCVLVVTEYIDRYYIWEQPPRYGPSDAGDKYCAPLGQAERCRKQGILHSKNRTLLTDTERCNTYTRMLHRDHGKISDRISLQVATFISVSSHLAIPFTSLLVLHYLDFCNICRHLIATQLTSGTFDVLPGFIHRWET
jgi:hypothetical protein